MKSSKFAQNSGNIGNTTMNNKNQPFLGSSRHGTCHVYNKYGSCVRKKLQLCPCMQDLQRTPPSCQSVPKQICQTTKTKVVPLRSLPSPVNPDVLSIELQGYDVSKKDRLLQGFKFGFKLGIDQQSRQAKNHNSTLQNPDIVYEKLAKESLRHRLTGPYSQSPLPDLLYSPLGLVPQSVPGNFRLIHDLSFSRNGSINSLIPKRISTVQYDSVDIVVNLVKHYGRFSQLAKCDIKDAFHIIPVHPSDYHLLGFIWNTFCYYDKCLPMGASSSCQIFESFSCALQWVMETKYHAAGMSHFIDDFIFVGPPNSNKCLQDLHQFLSLCERVGVPIKKEKTVNPTSVLSV